MDAPLPPPHRSFLIRQRTNRVVRKVALEDAVGWENSRCHSSEAEAVNYQQKHDRVASGRQSARLGRKCVL